jgi:uncharacterized protein
MDEKMDRSLKLEGLKSRIASKGGLLIAYSGGVDSSLLAKVATEVLGGNALCVILDSEVMQRSELIHAVELARSLDLNYRIAKYSILKDEEFVRNTPSRCYICRRASSKVLKEIAARCGIPAIADGVNLSDYEDYRPGIKACDEEGLWHPFVDSKISKNDIRQISRDMNLPFWNKPSSACLSSRLPYGERITKERLNMVEEAEKILRCLGLQQLRVRAHGGIARIEVYAKDMDKVLCEREEIVKGLKGIGFEYVTLDLEGFRSGSMNEVL